MAIVIVCVAGVSGTFLSLRLRRAGISVPVRVAGVQGLAAEPPRPGDLVLVAPQVAVSLDRVRALSDGADVLELTPADVSLGGAETLAVRVRRALRTDGDDHAALESHPDLEGETAS